MLNSVDGERQYKYSSFNEFSQLGSVIFSILLIILSLLSVFFLLEGVVNSTSLATSQVLGYITNFVAGIVLAVVNLVFAYSSPVVEVYERGLRLKVFPLKTLDVKWGDIAYIRKARWKPLLHNKYSSIVVVKNGLTRLHRFCAMVYGGPIQPSFVISPSISDYDDLMKVISNGIKKSRRPAQRRPIQIQQRSEI